MSCGQGVNIAPFARVKSIEDRAALPSLQQPGQVHPSEPFWRQRLLCPGNSGKSRCTESRCPQTRNSSSHINEFTRECLATDVARRMTSEDVLERLSDLLIQRGPPEYIRSDNGPEFTAHRVRDWLENVGVKTLFIEPGSPWENGFIESFNGKLRDELLNVELFDTLLEAKVLIERWRIHYNTVRLHSSLGYRPPAPEAVLTASQSIQTTT